MVCSCVKVNVDAVSLLSCIPKYLGKAFRYVFGLGKSGTDVLLTDKAKSLEAMKNHLSKQEGVHSVEPGNPVQQWIKKADKLLEEVENFKNSITNAVPCLRDCPCWSTDFLKRMEVLITEGKDLQPLGDVPPQRNNDIMPIQGNNDVTDAQKLVGGESTLLEVQRYLNQTEVNVIGIYGVPGTGKGALLKTIHHKLSEPGWLQTDGQDEAIHQVVPEEAEARQEVVPEEAEFIQHQVVPEEAEARQEVVPEEAGARQQVVSKKVEFIHEVVSEKPDVLALQRNILVKLGLPPAETPSEGGTSDAPDRVRQNQAATLLNKLMHKNVILLLEDVWNHINWGEIGIPPPGPGRNGAGCRVIFTTPLPQLCMGNGVGRIKVGFLGVDESRTLFRRQIEKMGGNVDEQSVEHAREVISRCGGLPGAIVAISNHLAFWEPNNTCGKTRATCRDTEAKLKHSPQEIGPLKVGVLKPLECKFKLQESKTRQCLLYCSLFPEDQNIRIHQLLDYWVGEGFLDAGGDLTLPEARRKGRGIIERLKDECLLEIVPGKEEEEATMHRMVRGMALWLTDGESTESTTLFLTSARLEASTDRRWARAERVSSMDGSRKVFPPPKTRCPQLLTLLFNNCGAHHLCCGQSQRTTQTTHQPGQCTIVGEPKHVFASATALRVLDLSGTMMENLPPEIGSLEELQHLNLSYTNIRSLPSQLGGLNKLRQLILRGTTQLSKIPNKSIPRQILQMLDLFGSRYTWRLSGWQINLEDLLEFIRLSEIGLTIKDHCSSLEALCSREDWAEKIVHLKLEGIKDLSDNHLSSISNFMKNLLELSIHGGGKITEFKISTGRFQELVVLDLCDLASLSSIEVMGHPESPLRQLRHLRIASCPELKQIKCINCQLCKKLTLDQGTASNIRNIVGERSWWEGLQWDATDDAIKSILLPRFTEAP